MPDIITLALIFCSAFLGATIAVGYFYGLHALGEWWHSRKTLEDVEDSPTSGTGVYDWKNDKGVTWRR